MTHPRRQVVLVTHPLATIGGANEQGVSDGVRWSFDLRDDGVDSSYQPRPPLKAESCAGVHVLGSHLMDIHGVGPVGAARILADVGDAAPVRRPEALWVLDRDCTDRRTTGFGPAGR